ncbi:MAG: hypothetical protein Q4B26_12995 [Eubacteriales bacterium]|nr:hypothetical protein [Eubacteriales bacterium]
MKKVTKKARALLVMVLSVTMLVGATISADAASANVMVTIEETDVNAAVTIPSTIPIIFNADGTNTYPTNWTITNNSEYASIKLSSVTGSTMTTGWKLLSELDEMKDVGKDSKKMKFYMGIPGKMEMLYGNTVTNLTLLYDNEGIPIEAGESETINFEIERGAFTKAVEEAVAVELTLNFEFI